MPAVAPVLAGLLLVACPPPAPTDRSTGGGWALPVGPPTSVLRSFSPPPPATPWLPGHRGVDLSAPSGSVVRSDGPGVVTLAGAVAGTGVVVVDHGGSLRSTFEPVVPTVRMGARLRTGDVLGHLGVRWLDASPAAALPRLGGHCGAQSCLHWGMLRGHWYVDPLLVTGVSASCRVVRLLPPAGPPLVGSADPPSTGASTQSPSLAGALGPPGPVPTGGSGDQLGGLVGAGSLVVLGTAAPAALAAVRRRRASIAAVSPTAAGRSCPS